APRSGPDSRGPLEHRPAIRRRAPAGRGVSPGISARWSRKTEAPNCLDFRKSCPVSQHNRAVIVDLGSVLRVEASLLRLFSGFSLAAAQTSTYPMPRDIATMPARHTRPDHAEVRVNARAHRHCKAWRLRH